MLRLPCARSITCESQEAAQHCAPPAIPSAWAYPASSRVGYNPPSSGAPLQTTSEALSPTAMPQNKTKTATDCGLLVGQRRRAGKRGRARRDLGAGARTGKPQENAVTGFRTGAARSSTGSVPIPQAQILSPRSTQQVIVTAVPLRCGRPR
jgi:hypothetical protein